MNFRHLLGCDTIAKNCILRKNCDDQKDFVVFSKFVFSDLKNRGSLGLAWLGRLSGEFYPTLSSPDFVHVRNHLFGLEQVREGGDVR